MTPQFPRAMKLTGTNLTMRPMLASDRDAVLDFAARLSEQDLLFMRRDITQADAVDAWIRDLESNRAFTLLLEDRGQIIGYGTLYYNLLFWNRHLGEIRVLISTPYTGMGLSGRIIRELMQLARDLELEKVVTYMSVDDRESRLVVEDLGFSPEAILADWVKTRDNRHHDLLIMSTSLVEITT